MLLNFDANQEYQLRAIESIAGLLDGQPRFARSLVFSPGTGFAADPNRLDIDEARILENLRAVQVRNGIPLESSLKFIEERIETPLGERSARFPNFSVEMETGTGKTYVYLRAMFELYRQYGLRKFIVVVPSVAIREGVLKTLHITRAHFRSIYGNTPYRYYVYDSDDLSQVRQFALSDAVEIMIMTIDSFNKASNIIRQSTDRLHGETPIFLIQAARPVLILDEPQNMESELRIRALSLLDPLMALRFSATHRNPYNLIYKLTPFEAYRQGLVKRIEVASVLAEESTNRPYIKLIGTLAEKNKVTARLLVHKLTKTGGSQERLLKVRLGDSLERLTRRTEYSGYDVNEISHGGGFVRFANNEEMRVGESIGSSWQALFEAQIRYAIDEHFRKQERYRKFGIKVLSLFFIDRVDSYARSDGIIRTLFKKTFDELKTNYSEWRGKDPEEVQGAYSLRGAEREAPRTY